MNNIEIFRYKYLLMLQLRFSPFIHQINMVYWQ